MDTPFTSTDDLVASEDKIDTQQMIAEGDTELVDEKQVHADFGKKMLNSFGLSSMQELRTETLNSLKETLFTAVPIVVSNVSYALVSSTDLAFAGFLGVDEQSACSLANTISIMFGTPVFGLSSALETLIANAYGHKNMPLIGLLVQRSVIIMTLACIPFCALFALAYPIVLGITNGDSNMAMQTLLFCLLLIPGTFATAYQRILTAFLNSQNQVWPVTIQAVATVFLNILLNQLFIFWIGWGFLGAAVATSVCRIIGVIFLVAFIKIGKLDKETWTGLHLRHAADPKGIKEFLKLGVPGAAALCCEVCSFNITVFICGFLGNAATASYSAVMSLTYITYNGPLGMSIAACILVGQKLGARKPGLAKFAALMTTIVTIIMSLGNAVGILSLRPFLPGMYSQDEEVRQLIRSQLLVAAGFQLFDGMQGVSSGICRGLSKMRLSFVANAVGYYVIGIPLACAFAFLLHLSTNGLWLGMTLGLGFVAIFLNIVLVTRINWEKEADEAVKRSEERGDTDDVPGEEVDVESAQSPIGLTPAISLENIQKINPDIELLHAEPPVAESEEQQEEEQEKLAPPNPVQTFVDDEEGAPEINRQTAEV